MKRMNVTQSPGKFLPKRARIAYDVGRRLFKNRKVIRKEYRAIKRGVQHLRSRRLQRSGFDRVESAHNASTIVSRTWLIGGQRNEEGVFRKQLRALEMKMCEPPQNGSNLRRAPGSSYFLKGFQLNYSVRNILEQSPIVVHIAVVQAKGDSDEGIDMSNNFFSSYIDEQRHTNFIDQGLDSSWDNNQMLSNLNPNKFNICMHKRVRLNPRSTTEDNQTSQRTGMGSSYQMVQRYYRINKEFIYESHNTDGFETDAVVNPLYLLVWFEHMFPVELEGPDPTMFMNASIVGFIGNTP
jgi:hypothetical protein